MDFTKVNETEDKASNLPYELLVHIFSYLDLISLRRCASVNKVWNDAAKDPSLYTQLNLQQYSKVTDETLMNLSQYCTRLKEFDISWSVHDTISEAAFSFFLSNCGTHMTHLSCEMCKFNRLNTINQIGNLKNLIKLRLKNCFVSHGNYASLGKLTNLITISLYFINITDKQVIMILKQNPNLKHINIGLCRRIRSLDSIARTVAQYNKDLVTWSSNEIKSMTSYGLMALAECRNLKELDLGWCQRSYYQLTPAFERIALGCLNLYRLILSGWQGLTDNKLIPIIKNCKGLVYLDVEYTLIYGPVCELALTSLPNLKFLDISYCRNIEEDEIAAWRDTFPEVTIVRSCEYE